MKTSVLRLRAKKLGILIRGARQSTNKTVAECAQALGISDDVFNSYELGDQSPSLPELEMLAYFLEVPMEHFWESEVYQPEEDHPLNPKAVLALRQRMVGAMIRKARVENGLSLSDFAAKAELDPEQLRKYELGEEPLPMPILDVLAEALGYQARYFLDQRGPLGMYFLRQKALKDFKELSPELQSFVCMPVNRPYLELAQRLSEMSVVKLRSVAEGLLEITL